MRFFAKQGGKVGEIFSRKTTVNYTTISHGS